jgi:hypothetical protein
LRERGLAVVLALTARDSLRGQVISALKQIAVYVQENSNGDLCGDPQKRHL